MTTTYTAENNPWRSDGTLRKRLDKEQHARSLAHNSIDLLGVVAAYAGQNWDGATKTNLFPGRALVTPRSDPARHVKYRRSKWHTQDGHNNNSSNNHEQDDDDVNYNNQSGTYDNNEGYYEDQQQEQQQSGYYDQQQQQQQQPQQDHSQSRSPPGYYSGSGSGFEYAGMSDLDALQQQQLEQIQPLGGTDPLDSTQRQRDEAIAVAQSAKERGATAMETYMQQQAHFQNRKFRRHSPVKKKESHNSFNYANDNEELTEEEARAIREERELAQRHGVRLHNSTRDLRRARECRYGLGTEKRGITAPTPVNYKLYPNRPVRDASYRDKPLLVDGFRGDFLRSNSALASVPAVRKQEVQANLEERRFTKSLALTKAIEELKVQDRAMLVNIPWFYSNHKNNQTHYLGGGTVPEAQPDFLLRNAPGGEEEQAALRELLGQEGGGGGAGSAGEEQQQQEAEQQQSYHENGEY